MRALTGLLLGIFSLPAAAAWFGPPCAGPALIPVSDHEVLLKVRRHEADAGADDTLRVLRDGRLQARPQALLDWGVATLEGRAQPDGEGGWWQTLDDIGGLEYRYDVCTQELLLDLRRTRRATHVLVANAAPRQPPQPATELGGYLNLDTQAVSGGEQSSLNGLVELGGFIGAGHGGASMLAREGQSLRLDTTWTLDQPDRLLQWVLGDTISREAPGRRSVRYAGISWGTEFALQPDVVIFPLPALRGDAVLPSTVDVYVDGVLRQRQDVPPGPFELRNVPVLSGGGQMQAVVRDLLGREQLLAQPFYVTPGLLREDLADYRVEAGWLRRNYGTLSNDYGAAFAAASYRRGLSASSTGALQADADADRQALGLGLVTQLGGWGSGSAELAGSRSPQGGGAQAQLGVQSLGAGINTALQLRAATTDYAALGDTREPARYAVSAYAGVPLWAGSNLSGTAVAESRRVEGQVQIYSLNFSSRLGADWLLAAQATRTLADAPDWLLGAGLTWLWGRRSASAYGQITEQGADVVRASWQQPSSGLLGLGYQVDVEQGLSDRALGQLRWSQERGILSAAAEVSEDSSALRYGLQTGLAWLGGRFFSTRPVQGSFALVDAAGAEGVRVYRDYQRVAVTDEAGYALVPDLRAYENNRIGLELGDLPIERRADVEHLLVVPYAHSGLRVAFPVGEPEPQRWLRLRGDEGLEIPAGARVAVTGGRGRAHALMGAGGRVLLEDAGSGALQLELAWPEGRCQTRVPPLVPGKDPEETLLCSRY